MALENIADWLSAGLDFYGKKRAADREANLQEKQIQAKVESKRLDVQIADATAARKNAAYSNTGFTDIKPMQIDIPYSDKPISSAMSAWMLYVVLGVVGLLVFRMFRKG